MAGRLVKQPARRLTPIRAASPLPWNQPCAHAAPTAKLAAAAREHPQGDFAADDGTDWTRGKSQDLLDDSFRIVFNWESGQSETLATTACVLR